MLCDMLKLQGGTLFGDIHATHAPGHLPGFGATILDSPYSFTSKEATQALFNVAGPTTPMPAPVQRPWWGEADRHWPHYFNEHKATKRDQNGQPLATDVVCSCDAEVEQPSLQHARMIGHTHSYRLVCPACRWYNPVADDADYPIPVHNANACGAAYQIARSELWANPVFHYPKFDPTPTQWRVCNGWTGKYICNANGGEHPDEEHAFGFPDEAAAVRFVHAQIGGASALAKALAASPKPADNPYCSSCGADWFRSPTTTCWRCSIPLSTTRGWCSVWPCNAKGQHVPGKVLTF